MRMTSWPPDLEIHSTGGITRRRNLNDDGLSADSTASQMDSSSDHQLPLCVFHRKDAVIFFMLFLVSISLFINISLRRNEDFFLRRITNFCWEKLSCPSVELSDYQSFGRALLEIPVSRRNTGTINVVMAVPVGAKQFRETLEEIRRAALEDSADVVVEDVERRSTSSPPERLHIRLVVTDLMKDKGVERILSQSGLDFRLIVREDLTLSRALFESLQDVSSGEICVVWQPHALTLPPHFFSRVMRYVVPGEQSYAPNPLIRAARGRNELNGDVRLTKEVDRSYGWLAANYPIVAFARDDFSPVGCESTEHPDADILNCLESKSVSVLRICEYDVVEDGSSQLPMGRTVAALLEGDAEEISSAFGSPYAQVLLNRLAR